MDVMMFFDFTKAFPMMMPRRHRGKNCLMFPCIMANIVDENSIDRDSGRNLPRDGSRNPRNIN